MRPLLLQAIVASAFALASLASLASLARGADANWPQLKS